MSGARWRTREDFLQPGTTDVPRNRLGITDRAELERVERVLSKQRSVELELAPLPGEFDLPHLQAIHRHLFGDVYAWAGVIRPFALFKGDDEFCRPQFITAVAADTFGRLHDAGLLRGLDAETFAAHAAGLLANLNSLHPFREGNGRTQRALVSQLATAAGHPLVWPTGAQQRNITASIAAHRGDNTGLQELIRDAIAAAGRPRPDTGN